MVGYFPCYNYSNRFSVAIKVRPKRRHVHLLALPTHIVQNVLQELALVKQMPKYDYACIQCDLDYEKEHSIHEKTPEYFCDDCNCALTRVFSPFGLSFKGGGFYKTGD